LRDVSLKLYIIDEVLIEIESTFPLVRADELSACTNYSERRKLRSDGKTFCFCLRKSDVSLIKLTDLWKARVMELAINDLSNI